MLQTKKLADKFIKKPPNNKRLKGVERVNEIRSNLPGITHIDYSCRVQTISKIRNKLFHELE